MYTFYYYPGACSKACSVLMQDLGVSYKAQMVDVMNGEQRSPEYLKMNPRGQVPMLQDGNFYLTEGMAIMMYMFEKYPTSKLMPKEYPARGKAYEGMMYMNSTVHQMYAQYFKAKKTMDPAFFAKIEPYYFETMTKYYDDMEKYYGQYKFYAGEEMSMADVMFTIMADWNAMTNFNYKFGPNTQRVINAVYAYPAFKTVTEKEKSAYQTSQAA